MIWLRREQAFAIPTFFASCHPLAFTVKLLCSPARVVNLFNHPSPHRGWAGQYYRFRQPIWIISILTEIVWTLRSLWNLAVLPPLFPIRTHRSVWFQNGINKHPRKSTDLRLIRGEYRLSNRILFAFISLSPTTLINISLKRSFFLLSSVSSEESYSVPCRPYAPPLF